MDLEVYLTIFLWHLALLVPSLASANGTKVIVKTDKGRVEGRRHAVHGNKIDTFFGIPYARPPLGNLRFVHPEQLDPWPEIRDASKLPNSCMQAPDTFFGNFSGSSVWNPNTNISEDCLYLNVWAPHDRSHTRKRPVMVWVYGGAFSTGTSTLDVYDAKFLAAEYGVIVVSMQLRVGSLGFFVLGSPDSPGNAGMMDLRMSLEWVQRNIHHFGGDAHNVTLIGESSGAACIGLLMLSSLGRGFFHRAILQSAAPQLGWSTYTLDEGRKRSLKLANRLGCNISRSDRDILDCLRKLPAHRFPEKEGVTSGLAQFPFVPVIDGTFLTKTPAEYLKEGLFKKIPVLLGANSNEGSWLLAYEAPDYFNISTPSWISPDAYVSLMNKLFDYYPQYPHKMTELGKNAVRFRYRDWLDPDNQIKLRKSIVQAAGDFHFTCGITELANVVASHGQEVYLYRFSHRMSTSPWPEWMGVLHGDEIFFVFGRPLVRSLGFTSEERKLSRKVMKMWTNFAKTGNPNHGPDDPDSEHVLWPRYIENEQEFLEINLDLVKGHTSHSLKGRGLQTQHCAFWQHYVPQVAELVPKHSSNCSCYAASLNSGGRKEEVTTMITFTLISTVLLYFKLLRGDD